MLTVLQCPTVVGRLQLGNRSMKNIALSALLLFAFAGPAAAGSTTLKKDGKSYSLNCTNAGCFLSEKISLFKSGPRKKLGAGGTSNYNAWRKKLKSQGYN